MTNEIKKALIYCRVSDVKQKLDGSGLTSQEFRCRQYAASRSEITKLKKCSPMMSQAGVIL